MHFPFSLGNQLYSFNLPYKHINTVKIIISFGFPAELENNANGSLE